MKLYQFSNEDHCSIIYCVNEYRITELKSMGYYETPQEAKESHIQKINDRIENISQNYKRELADLSAKINVVKNF